MRALGSLLRKTLARAHGLDETASHDPAYLFGDLALGTVAQVHAPYTPELHASLRKRSVIVVTPRRHPLDVLLSMLHFAQFEPDVSCWLGGNYLDYFVLSHDTVHGQERGIFWVEVGVAITVSGVMMKIFYMFAARRKGEFS